MKARPIPPSDPSMERSCVVALIGNPNTGKSTIFNRLTGLRQRIANYPGVTVDRKSGRMRLDAGEIEILDLPGTYSLTAVSHDERVVMDVLGGRRNNQRPDLLVFVVDATNLKRNLFLVSQAAELGLPAIIALNQSDAALANGLRIDAARLSRRLGVPVVETVGSSGRGLPELKAAIAEALEAPCFLPRIAWPECISAGCVMLRDGICTLGCKDISDAEVLRVLFDRESVYTEPIREMPRLNELIHEAHDGIRKGGLSPGSVEAVLHYRHIETLLEGVVESSGPVARTRESVDRILLHRVWGTLIFFGVMYAVFQSLYTWSGPLMDAIEMGTGWLQNGAAGLLVSTPVLQSLVCDGILAGVGGVLVFLPQILLLFFFISLLEDTGYVARAAFLMDKLFGWCGLNGKSFVPLLSGYACAIPGVMAARTIEDPKARLTTILMTPFMSCSARLPIYILLIGTFVEPIYGAYVAGWALFVMHFVGAAIALPLAWLLNRFILKIKPLPFILEMPDYRLPVFRNVIHRMWERGREFVLRAGTVILAFSVIIWALLYFPHQDSVASEVRAEWVKSESESLPAAELQLALQDPDSPLSQQLAHRIEAAYIEQSYLGRFGKTVQPIFNPAGFDWKITVGVLSSFPAREVIIATMGIIYNLGAEVDEGSGDLRSVLREEKWTSGPRIGQPVYTLPVVFAMMVFFALCMQCGATVAVVAKELTWGWALASFVGMTLLAWVAAVAVYQVGRMLPPLLT